MPRRIDEQLLEAIESQELSINALAKAAGVPQASLQRFHARTRDITLETAAKLAAYFGLELMPVAARRPAKKRAKS